MSFFASPPTPLQLERGALLSGFAGVYRVKRFVWVFMLNHECPQAFERLQYLAICIRITNS
jgi:hypothetical protein